MLLSQLAVRRCIILVVLTFSSFIHGQQQNSCGCVDIPPPGTDCEHQKYILGNCDSKSILYQDYCAVTCDRCICRGDCQCTDIPPDHQYSCKELQFYERCDEQWILDGQHCEYSCGRCSCLQGQEQQVQGQQISNSTNSANSGAPYTIASMPTLILSQEQDSLPLTQQTLPFTPIPQQQNQVSCDQEFLNMLGSNPDTMYMVDLLRDSPLLLLFQVENPEPYTFFMPNYYSWKNLMATLAEPEELLADQILMLQLLATHMVKGAYAYPEIASIGVFKTMMKDANIYAYLEGAQLMIGVDYKDVYRVSNIAIPVCNSVIYILNGVLIDERSRINDMFAIRSHFLNLVVGEFEDEDFDEDIDEIPEMESEKSSERECRDISALEIINKHPQLKIISQLIDKAEMRDILGKDSKNMTFFMPMDSADFSTGGVKSQAALLQLDPVVIRDIVRYHIVQGELVDLRGFRGSEQLETLSDRRIVTLQSSQSYYTLKGQTQTFANIVDENIGNACNVMVHMLDRVLYPYTPEQAEALYPSSPSPSLNTAQFCSQTVWSVFAEQPGLSILHGVENRVDQMYMKGNHDMTVFLPDARGQDQITKLSEELASTLETANDIAYDLILYHIVENQLLDLRNNTGIGEYPTSAQLPIKVEQEGKDFYVEGIGSSAKISQVGQVNPCNPILIHQIEGALFPYQKENSGTKGVPTQDELQKKLQMSQANGASTKCRNNITLIEFLEDEPRLSYLVEKAGDNLQKFLADSIGKNGKTTFFLPVNDAFVDLEKNKAVMDFLKTDAELAKLVLQYHAVPDKLINVNTIARMPIREESPQITSFNTIAMTLRKQFGVLLTIGQVKIGRAIELSAYESCSIVVHLINEVLLPFEIRDPSNPAPTPAPSPPTSSYYPYDTHQVSVNLANYQDQYVQAQAIATTVQRGESPLNAELQVVNGAPPSTAPASPLGSDISQFFPGSTASTDSGSSESEIQHCNKTIAAVMEQNSRLSQWARFMRLAGYANYLDQSNANITIIAPVASAFDSNLYGMNISLRELAADEEQRELFVKIISFHIIPYPVNVRDTPVGTSGSFGTLWFDDGGYEKQVKMRKFMEPFAQGETLVVEGVVNNATVSGSPLNFCKAYIYPVDKVLGVEEEVEELPAVVVQAPAPYRPIVDAGSLLPNVTISSCIKPLQIIQNQHDLSTFIGLVYYANINEVINGLEGITIFAPIDQNLNQILNQMSNLQEMTPTVIQNWMAYHIVTGEYTVNDLKPGLELESLTLDSQGNKMNLTVDIREDDEQIYLKGVFNEAYIVRSNLQACNAIIHIVSMPLLPVNN